MDPKFAPCLNHIIDAHECFKEYDAKHPAWLKVKKEKVQANDMSDADQS